MATNTGQLWYYVDNETGSGPNDGFVADVGYASSNTSNQNTSVVTDSAGYSNSGYALLQNPTSTGLDTANNLLFVLADDGGQSGSDNNGTIYVYNLTTGALLSHQEIGNFYQGEEYGPLAVDPVHHLVYVDIFGGLAAGNDRPEDEILAVSYNPATGVLSTPAYNPVSETQSSNANTVISNQSDSHFSYGSDLALDQKTNTLYFANSGQDYQDGASPPNDYPARNEIDAVNANSRNATSLVVITSLPDVGASNFPGLISSIAIDDPDNLIFFTTTESSGGGTDSIWYAPLGGGGTAKQLNTGSTAFQFYSDNIAFDPASHQLYVANGVTSSPGEILKYTISAGGGTASITGTSTFYTYGGTNPSGTNPYVQNIAALTFDSLPALIATGTATKAVQNGSAVTVLAGGTTVTDPDSGGFITGATVTISNAKMGDVLSINGTTFGSAAASFTDTNGAKFNISYGGGVLTITSPSDPTNGVTTTDAQYAHLLSEIQYTDGYTDNSNDAHPTRAVTIQVNDGAAGSPSGQNTATTTLTIDRAPTISASGSVAYTVGGTPAKVDATLAVTDLDGDNQTSATVAIFGLVSGDVLSATTTGTGITANYNSSTGVLSLSGAGSTTQYAQVLDSVTFSSTVSGTTNAANFPNAGNRVISYTVNDGVTNSNTPSTSLTIAANAFADTAANVASKFDAINSDTSITSITVTDGNTIVITQTQANNDSRALSIVHGATVEITGTSGNGYSSDTKTYNSSGVVTSETFGGVTGHLYSGETITYGAGGVQTGATFTGYTGKPYTTVTETFDSSGRVSTQNELNGSGTVIGSYSYAYGTGGAYTTTFSPPPGNNFTTQVQSYDGSGDLLSNTYNGVASEPYTSETFTYTAAGVHTSTSYSGYTSGAYASSAYTYNSSGQVTSYTTYDTGHNALLTSTYTYGTGGAYTLETTYAPGTGYSYADVITAYDGSGHKLSAEYDGLTGRAYTTQVSTYDTSGTVLTLTESGFSGAYSSLRYDYTGGVAQTETFFNTNGSHTVTALATGAALTDTAANEAFTLTTGDTFALPSATFGQDTISHYTPGSDTFNISSAVFQDFSHFIADAQSDGHGNTVVTYDAGDTLTFLGISIATLNAHQSDFHFT